MQEYNEIVDKRIFWDLLKFDIQCKSIEISKHKAKEKRQLEDFLTKKCEMLYTKICDSTITQTEQEEYLSHKNTLEDLYRYKEQGAYIRSRADFIEKKNEKAINIFIIRKNHFLKRRLLIV